MAGCGDTRRPRAGCVSRVSRPAPRGDERRWLDLLGSGGSNGLGKGSAMYSRVLTTTSRVVTTTAVAAAVLISLLPGGPPFDVPPDDPPPVTTPTHP